MFRIRELLPDKPMHLTAPQVIRKLLEIIFEDRV
jgi:hypothetical protein